MGKELAVISKQPYRWTRLGRSGREEVIRRFNLETQTGSLIQLYEQVSG